MNKWLKCICQVCGLKSTEDGLDAYRVEAVETPGEVEVEREEVLPHPLRSNDSSPTLSSSSPYIPISECITGNPILSNDSSSAGHDTGYCNTTFFPFPPRVNWATHPSKPESDTTPSPSKVGPIAPPRPPKKKSSPSFAGNPVTPIAISSCTSTESVRTVPTPSSASSRTVFRYDKFHDNEPDLMGTYLQIEPTTSMNTATGGTAKFHINSKGSLKLKDKEMGLHVIENSGVEYRMIDHVKTRALNQMIQEREEQLSRPTNSTIKSLHH